jgi:hypothetical protein
MKFLYRDFKITIKYKKMASYIQEAIQIKVTLINF